MKFFKVRTVKEYNWQTKEIFKTEDIIIDVEKISSINKQSQGWYEVHIPGSSVFTVTDYDIQPIFEMLGISL